MKESEEVLEALRDADNLLPLVSLLQDKELLVRECALYALNFMLAKANWQAGSGPERIEDLKALLGMEGLPEQTREDLVRIAGESGNPEFIGVLLPLVGSAGPLSGAAERAIIRIGKAGQESLKKHLRSLEIRGRGRNAIIKSLLVRFDDEGSLNEALSKPDSESRMVEAMLYHYQHYSNRQEEIKTWLENVYLWAQGRLNLNRVSLKYKPEALRRNAYVGLFGPNYDLTHAAMQALQQIKGGREFLLASRPGQAIEFLDPEPVSPVLEQAEVYDASYFNQPPESINRLIEYSEAQGSLSAAEGASKAAALLALLRDPLRKAALEGSIGRQPMQGQEAMLLAALNCPQAVVRGFAYGLLEQLGSDNLSPSSQEVLRDYKMFLSFIEQLLRQLRALEYSEEDKKNLTSIFDALSVEQALEVAKILATPDLLERVAEVLWRSRHYRKQKGDILAAWLAEMGSLDYAKRIERWAEENNLPTEVRGYIGAAKDTLEMLEELKTSYLNNRQRAKDKLNEFYEALPPNTWVILKRLFDYETPLDFKLLIAEAIQEKYHAAKGRIVESAAQHLSRMPEAEFFPIWLKPHAVNGKPAGNNGLVKLGNEVSIGDLFGPDKSSSPVVTQTPGGIDPSRSLRIDSPTGNLGGIDFRFLPIITQAISNLSKGQSLPTLKSTSGTVPTEKGTVPNSSLLKKGTVPNEVRRLPKGQSLQASKSQPGTVPTEEVPEESFAQINLNEEWQQIERMIKAGLIPSAERLKEYLQTACYQGGIDKDKVILCISDILRLEEERCSPTDPTLRDILVVLEASQNPTQLKEVFLGS